MNGGFMLDAGALIAIDRGDRRMLAHIVASSPTARGAVAPMWSTSMSFSWRYKEPKRS